MNKKIIGIIVVIAIVALVVAFVFMKPGEEGNKEPENNETTPIITETSLPEIKTAEDLSTIVDSIYKGYEDQLPALQTQVIDISDTDMVKYVTGLDNADDLEFVVASEPLMSSQAYSLVLVKVKDAAKAEDIASEMNSKIDNRKWVCVTADVVFSTFSKDIVCLVMSNSNTARTIFDRFISLAGETGPEYERNEEVIELPEDMY